MDLSCRKVAIRLPTAPLAFVDAHARQCGISDSQMICEVLAVAGYRFYAKASAFAETCLPQQ